jgi:hypothetical protein
MPGLTKHTPHARTPREERFFLVVSCSRLCVSLMSVLTRVRTRGVRGTMLQQVGMPALPASIDPEPSPKTDHEQGNNEPELLRQQGRNASASQQIQQASDSDPPTDWGRRRHDL